MSPAGCMHGAGLTFAAYLPALPAVRVEGPGAGTPKMCAAGSHAGAAAAAQRLTGVRLHFKPACDDTEKAAQPVPDEPVQ